MDKTKKILVIEDDPNMGFLLREFLSANGFEVALCVDGDRGLEAFRQQKADFCIVDVMLPGIDGFTLAERIRKEDARVPIVFLTARSMKQDKLKGFNLGGDDYITKPFDEEELLCRIHAIFNRVGNSRNDEEAQVEEYPIGRYLFDVRNQALVLNGNNDRLTYRECDVLSMLCAHKGKLVKRSDLLQKYWGKDDYFNGRSLDVFITRLRKRLAKDPSVKIENVPKVGYILQD